MDIKCYLAMTAAELDAVERQPAHIAWMACHFSCYGTGLSNLPASIPTGSMIIVNDRTPPHGHDPELISKQLCRLVETMEASCVLLDLQRPGIAENERIAQALTETLPCPVGVSAIYAKDLSCPVFLDAPPPNSGLDAWLKPWAGRDIWLEAATEAICATVTEADCRFSSANDPLPEISFTDDLLHCSYHMEILEDRAVFTIQRTVQQVHALLEEAEKSGVVQAVGLYQQLGARFPYMTDG